MRFLEVYLTDHGLKAPEDLERMIKDRTLAKLPLPEKPHRSAPYLSTVALDLIAAMTFATEHNLQYFGDIANRLFPCLPLPTELEENNLPKREDYEGLIQKLDALNQRAIVMQWGHLRQASAWVTAGGSLKLNPVWTLAIVRYIEQRHLGTSSQAESIMTQLTTDSQTAQELLDALASFKKKSDRIKQWYIDLAKVLFQRDDRSSNASVGR